MKHTNPNCQNLKTFERNKYFYGKLLTVDDFQTEQDYFRQKIQLLNQGMEGSGIVYGLELSQLSLRGEELSVTIEKGYAIDVCGNLIVVESTKSYSINNVLETPLLYLYLTYKEQDKDPVASISDTSCDEGCCNNRIKEGFHLEIDNQAPTEYQGEGVLIASLTQTEAGYQISTDLNHYLLSNQELEQYFSEHTENTENPHHVTAEHVGAIRSINRIQHAGNNIELKSKNGSIEIESNNDTKEINLSVSETILAELHSKITSLEHNLESVLYFMMDKTLKYKRLAFTQVRERFQSKQALEIVKEVQEALDQRLYLNKDAFLELLLFLSKFEKELIPELEKQVSKEPMDDYISAVKNLEKHLKNKDLFILSIAQDEVSERAEKLLPTNQKVKVPTIISLSIDEAKSKLIALGLFIGAVSSRNAPDKPEGSILSQNPKANTQVDKGSVVHIEIATKSNQATVPNLIKKTLRDARKLLLEANLTLGKTSSKVSSTLSAGTILAQNPSANTKLDIGSKVNITLAKAPNRVRVPQLVNLPQSTAQKALKINQLTLGNVSSIPSTKPQGTVLSQSPKEGQMVAIGSKINISVASRQNRVSVPNFVGLGNNDAKKIKILLKKSRLQAGNATFVNSSKPKGTIIAQTPTANSKVAPGTAIDFKISNRRGLRFDPRDPIVFDPRPPVVDPRINPVTPARPDFDPIVRPSVDVLTPRPSIVSPIRRDFSPLPTPFPTRSMSVKSETGKEDNEN